MEANFAACVGFTLLPANDGQPCHATSGDPGGATAWGITHATLSDWLGRPATLDDMRALTAQTAAPIYRDRFWRPCGGDGLAAGLDLMVFDHAVTCGPADSVRLLQGVVGTAEDGILGPVTLAACACMDVSGLIAELSDEQAANYGGMGDFWRFGRGWLKRLERRRDAAIGMAANTL